MHDPHNTPDVLDDHTFTLTYHGKAVGELTVQIDEGLEGVDIPHACQAAATAVSEALDIYHQAAMHDEDEIMDDDLRPWALTLRFGGAEEGLMLNKEFRHKDYATNVLSFVADDDDTEDTWYVGDIFICSPVLAREAEELEKPLEDHLKHLVVHGMLHLVGYDHELGEAEAEKMENLERAIMADMGLADPYLDHEKLEAKKGQ